MAVDPAMIAGELSRVATRGVIALVSDVVHGRITKRMQGGGREVEVIEWSPPPPLPTLSELGLAGRLGEHLGTGVEGSRLAEEIEAQAGAELFAGVVGLEYEKQQLLIAVSGPWAPTKHRLLWGPPASGKSILLEELRSLPEARYVVAQRLSPAGLEEIVTAEPPPRILLLEELDKAPAEAQAALLTVMDGNVAPGVRGRSEERRVEVRVIAAANDPNRLIEPLRARFVELPLAEYGEAERRQVIEGFLVGRKGMEAAEAREVAALVAPVSADVRDAEQLADVRREDPELARVMAERLARQRLESTARERRGRRQRMAAGAAR